MASCGSPNSRTSSSRMMVKIITELIAKVRCTRQATIRADDPVHQVGEQDPDHQHREMHCNRPADECEDRDGHQEHQQLPVGPDPGRGAHEGVVVVQVAESATGGGKRMAGRRFYPCGPEK